MGPVNTDTFLFSLFADHGFGPWPLQVDTDTFPLADQGFGLLPLQAERAGWGR